MASVKLMTREADGHCRIASSVDGGINILLVEDKDSDAMIVSSIFENDPRVEGFERRKSGDEALELLDAAEDVDAPFDLILIDINMPRMNGFELLTKIRARERQTHARIVILTSSDAMTDFHRCLLRRANSFIVKPSSMDQLRAKLDETIRLVMAHEYMPKLIDANDVSFEVNKISDDKNCWIG